MYVYVIYMINMYICYIILYTYIDMMYIMYIMYVHCLHTHFISNTNIFLLNDYMVSICGCRQFLTFYWRAFKLWLVLWYYKQFYCTSYYTCLCTHILENKYPVIEFLDQVNDIFISYINIATFLKRNCMTQYSFAPHLSYSIKSNALFISANILNTVYMESARWKCTYLWGEGFDRTSGNWVLLK